MLKTSHPDTSDSAPLSFAHCGLRSFKQAPTDELRIYRLFCCQSGKLEIFVRLNERCSSCTEPGERISMGKDASSQSNWRESLVWKQYLSSSAVSQHSPIDGPEVARYKATTLMP